MQFMELSCAASFTSVPLVTSVGGGVIEWAPDVNGLRFDLSTGFAGSEARASTVRIGPFPRMPSYLAPCCRQDAHYQLLVHCACTLDRYGRHCDSGRTSTGTLGRVSSGVVR